MPSSADWLLAGVPADTKVIPPVITQTMWNIEGVANGYIIHVPSAPNALANRYVAATFDQLVDVLKQLAVKNVMRDGTDHR